MHILPLKSELKEASLLVTADPGRLAGDRRYPAVLVAGPLQAAVQIETDDGQLAAFASG